MADISQEIAAFQNAVYGEEVRSSMVSAIEKINDVAEDAESTVESFSSGVTTAISNANTAASAANTAATNANTKASAANTAATNANTARTAANNAATAANNAASAATTTNTNITNAESARVTAEQARATAEATRQANEQSRQTAETARVNAESARASAESSRASAESQRQSNETTRQGNENVRQTQEGLRVSAENSRVSEFEDMQAAFADMQRQIIPQATESTMGGVIVGDGLNVDNALLSLATTKSGSGTAVASNGAVLESVVVYGESVQDGTPTPSAPVDVQVVEGRNLANIENGSYSTDYTTKVDNATRLRMASHVAIDPNTPCILSYYADKTIQCTRAWFDSDMNLTSTSPWTPSTSFTSPENAAYLVIIFRYEDQSNISYTDVRIQLEVGSTATPYVPYGSIGLVVGGVATPIDLQGNFLASLPDGTRDTVTVDSAGHCVLTKNVAAYTVLGTESTYSSSDLGTYYRTVLHISGDDTEFISCYPTNSPVGWCNYAPFSTGYSVDSLKVCVSRGSGAGTYRTDVILFAAVDSAAAVLTAYTGAKIMYRTANPKVIDLGYIDMPTIPEDATISVSASITPVIDASWWERGAEALANIVKAFSERIKALEEAVAEIATA